MASPEMNRSKSLPGNTISVDVEEALEDLFVVSYKCGSKMYQGVLLDCTKMNMPHGIVPPLCAFGTASAHTVSELTAAGDCDSSGKKSEKFFSLRQRFTYFQQTHNENSNILQGHMLKKRSNGSKDSKPTRVMRLRPRQVLCSKCKSICNENSENVESLAKSTSNNNQSISKTDFGVNTSPRLTLGERINCNIKTLMGSDVNRCSPVHPNHGTSPRALDRCDVNTPRLVVEKMILRKRKPDDITDDGDGCVAPRVTEEWTKTVPVNDAQSNSIDIPPAPKLMVSRNETANTFEAKVIEKPECTDEPSNCESDGSIGVKAEIEPKINGPVIKISYANPKGEGTVMKIPRRVGAVVPPSPVHSSDDQCVFRPRSNYSPNPHKDDASAKAARKALKKAKKEAQRKLITSGVMPTKRIDSPVSIAYGSPPHRNRNKHHHKHKLKHKRKHRDDEHWVVPNNVDSTKSWNCSGDGESECMNVDKSENTRTYVKQAECLKQRLSISLKRLNKTSYYTAPTVNSYDDFNSESRDSNNHSESSLSNNSDNSSDCPHEVSDINQLNKVKPLMMRITTHNVNKTYLNGGRVLYVDDVVWGKIQGFPWWPGKIVAITVSQRDNGTQINQQAHITWYGSSTSSYMLCHRLLPFLEEFKNRYNKKKRGPYKEAIRQATEDAKSSSLGKLAVKDQIHHSHDPL